MVRDANRLRFRAGGVGTAFAPKPTLFGRVVPTTTPNPDLRATIAAMKYLLLLALSFAVGCSTKVESKPPQSPITAMSIDNGKESFFECNTERWSGRVTVAPDVKVGYRSVTTPSARGSQSNITLMLNDVLVTIEPEGLRFGADTRVPLTGETAVQVRADGVFVKGAKVTDLPTK